MKPEKKRTRAEVKRANDSINLQLNDIGFRLVLIPFFGIAIPLATGMIDPDQFTHWEVKLAYGYTILLAFVVWQGNRYLLFTLRSYFNWFNRPVRKILALLMAVSFFTIPVSLLMLTGWYNLFAKGRIDWDVVFTSTLIIMICVIFITHVYETVFLVKESESDKVRNEQMERARAEAELEALKNQIDPHFIFNSLNTLSHLIEEKPARAKQFNDNMADVYRYILQNKARDLVLLREELDFLKNYFFMIRIRFESAVQLDLNIPAEAEEAFLLPPISLQVLAENAVKHNEFNDAQPLHLGIYMEGESIVVKNRVQKKESRKHSSRIGLNNLKERYRLTTGREVEISETQDLFMVRLPLLKMN
jgi:sensor histidine kinase YesM